MKNKNNITTYFSKKFCYFLSSLLVISSHKLQFKRYIATGIISKDDAFRLYDNLLFNLQYFLSKIFTVFAGIICIILYENFIIFFLVSIITLFLSIIMTYYPCRIMINLIYPKEYHNGSNKNYLLKVNNFGLKDQTNIRKYVPFKPTLKNIGSYAPWRCPECKKTNLIENRVCAKCDFEYYWKCYECETLNISDNISCVRCDMPKDRTQELRNTWTCNKCKEEHENIFTDCWNCLSAK